MTKALRKTNSQSFHLKRTNENSVVLDRFCGSGTTLKSAQTRGRKWVGIDQSEQAVKAITDKLESGRVNLLVPKPKYEFIELEAALTLTPVCGDG